MISNAAIHQSWEKHKRQFSFYISNLGHQPQLKCFDGLTTFFYLSMLLRCIEDSCLSSHLGLDLADNEVTPLFWNQQLYELERCPEGILILSNFIWFDLMCSRNQLFSCRYSFLQKSNSKPFFVFRLCTATIRFLELKAIIWGTQKMRLIEKR